jgi:hypothetical protein
LIEVTMSILCSFVSLILPWPPMLQRSAGNMGHRR